MTSELVVRETYWHGTCASRAESILRDGLAAFSYVTDSEDGALLHGYRATAFFAHEEQRPCAPAAVFELRLNVERLLKQHNPHERFPEWVLLFATSAATIVDVGYYRAKRARPDETANMHAQVLLARQRIAAAGAHDYWKHVARRRAVWGR